MENQWSETTLFKFGCMLEFPFGSKESLKKKLICYDPHKWPENPQAVCGTVMDILLPPWVSSMCRLLWEWVLWQVEEKLMQKEKKMYEDIINNFVHLVNCLNSVFINDLFFRAGASPGNPNSLFSGLTLCWGMNYPQKRLHSFAYFMYWRWRSPLFRKLQISNFSHLPSGSIL